MYHIESTLGESFTFRNKDNIFILISGSVTNNVTLKNLDIFKHHFPNIFLQIYENLKKKKTYLRN